MAPEKVPKKVRWKFYDNNKDYLVIPTFRTRIDRSKAPRGRKDCDPPETDAVDGTSKYFIKSASHDQAPFDCTLLDEEAKQYGYRKERDIYEDPEARARAIKRWRSKEPRRLPFFTPSTTLGLIGPKPGENVGDTKGDSGARKNLTLKEQLDRNILRMTRVSMSYACKQYPSLPSRNLLDKYAFLFGLKPNK